MHSVVLVHYKIVPLFLLFLLLVLTLLMHFVDFGLLVLVDKGYVLIQMD